MIKVIIGLVMLWGFLTLGYQVPREDFLTTSVLYALLFGLMVLSYYLDQQQENLLLIFIVGFAIRASLITTVPSWSDDYPRFLWDGELVSMHQNPYLETPDNWLIDHPEQANSYMINLHQLMNSPGYFSVYPPANQFLFWLSATLADQNIFKGLVTLRFLLIIGEIGVFFLLTQLFLTFKIPLSKLSLYWLNPLVILEITGNLHFEGLVLICLLASIFFLIKNKMTISGSFWGLSIGVKLLPLMLFPALFSFSKTRKSMGFWVGVFIVTLVSFLGLMIDDSWMNFFKSIQLYQGTFEFNASIYYLMREIGFWMEGYNTIFYLTKILTITTIVAIGVISWIKKPSKPSELIDLWIMIYLIYLILQPVVHPWYLIPGLGLSLFTGRISFLAWSLSVILSYHAYGNIDNQESPVFLVLEYAVLFAALYFDYFRSRTKTLTTK